MLSCRRNSYIRFYDLIGEFGIFLSYLLLQRFLIERLVSKMVDSPILLIRLELDLRNVSRCFESQGFSDS